MTDPRPLGNREVLRLPEFRKLFAAQAISDIGDAMTFLALVLTVNDLTHSPFAIALLSIVVAVPSMVGGLLAGGLADRLDRRRVMLASDSVRAVLVLGFVFIRSTELLPLLYLIAFVQAAIGTLFSPARGALVPRTVPREGLVAANSVSQTARIIASVVGTTIVGSLYAASGSASFAFVVDAVTFAASVAIVRAVTPALGQPAGRDAAASRGLRGSVADGLRLIGRSPTLIATLVGATVATLGLGAVNVLFLPFLVNVLGESAAWSGPAEGAQTLAMIGAAAVVPIVSRRLPPQALQVIGLAGLGVMTAALYATPNAPVLLADLFVLGWFLSPAQIATSTLIQTAVDDSTRGRIIGAVQATTSTASIASMAAAGAFADVVGIRVVLLVGGLVCVASAFAAAALFAVDRRATHARSMSSPDPVP